MTIASLATSSTLLVGRNATAVDISAIGTIPVDIILGGRIMTGTSPTAGFIQVWASASEDGTIYTGGIATADAAQTLVAATKAQLRLVANMANDTTNNASYAFVASMMSVFGGILPRRFNLWLTHSSGVNLNSTGGNHQLKYTPINYQSA